MAKSVGYAGFTVRTVPDAGQVQNIQPQNLPRTYIDKSLLPMTRELAKAEDGEALQMLYGSAASTCHS